MSGNNQLFYKILTILAWIIFIGLCAEAGSILVNAVFAIAINPANATYFWSSIDLSAQLQYDKGQFIIISFFRIVAAVFKFLLFYFIVKTMSGKKWSLQHAFSTDVLRLISPAAYLALRINYRERLTKKGIELQAEKYSSMNYRKSRP